MIVCDPCRWWSSGRGRYGQPPAWMSCWDLQTFLTGSCGSVACACSSRRPSLHLHLQWAHTALRATLLNRTAWRYLKVGYNIQYMLSVCVLMWLWTLCVSHFSHRWRVAADSVHAEGDVCRRGQGAGHRPLHVLQTSLCLRPQVCLTWNQIHRTSTMFTKLSATAPYLHPVTLKLTKPLSSPSCYIQLCWIDAEVETNVE